VELNGAPCGVFSPELNSLNPVFLSRRSQRSAPRGGYRGHETGSGLRGHGEKGTWENPGCARKPQNVYPEAPFQSQSASEEGKEALISWSIGQIPPSSCPRGRPRL
jgi:hypothetical protein